MPGILLFIIAIIMVGYSCEKVTGPASVRMNFVFHYSDTMENGKLILVEDTNSFPLQFETGRIIIHSINFEGSREEGEDVIFTSDFDTVINANLIEGTTNFPVIFDVPQGTYTYINLSLLIDSTEEIPALEIEGKYTGEFNNTEEISNVQQSEMDFNYKFTDKEVIDLIVYTKENEDIVISENKMSKIKVMIDPEFIFQNTTSKFEHANLNTNAVSLEYNNTIFISKDSNAEIYEETVSGNRLEKATEAIFLIK